jgi:rubrerythrin
MIDDNRGRAAPTLTIGSLAEWHAVASRRTFLRLVGLGGVLALLPSVATACGSDPTTAPSDGVAGSGDPVIIDFAQGDTAILQYAFVLEQLEADFYSRLVSSFGSSTIPAAEQAVLTDIRNHELAHREFLRATLGASGAPAITSTFRGVNFTDRTAVLTFARTLEDLGVAAYNGAAQYVTGPATLIALAKIVSVEARHAATIRDLLEPRTGSFAPAATDDVFRPAKVAAAVQANLVDKLGFANAPSTFVQGPNGSG